MGTLLCAAFDPTCASETHPHVFEVVFFVDFVRFGGEFPLGKLEDTLAKLVIDKKTFESVQ